MKPISEREEDLALRLLLGRIKEWSPRERELVVKALRFWQSVRNPVVVIVGRAVKAVEYLDVPKAKKEAIENPYTRWRHDVKVKDAVLYGLPDGSLLIQSRSGTPLWGYR